VLDIRGWSFGRVVLASVLWMLLVVVLVNGSMLAMMAIQMWRDSRRAEPAGIGAVTFRIGDWWGWAVLLGPPIAFGATWYFLRRT
jgi:uncharacterized membrane protein